MTDNNNPSNTNVQVFNAEWDDEGVYFYQAFCPAIADFAVEHQTLGGPAFKPVRMTWIKPSFAWMLYRSHYGHKKNQERILKIKIGHESLASILSSGCCKCGHGHGGALGRVQWDPERDIMAPSADGKEPRRMLRQRAIQIGLSNQLSEIYVKSILEIQDVTDLAHRVGQAHAILLLAKTKKNKNNNDENPMEVLKPDLPVERPYIPHVSHEILADLAMAPGPAADETARLGLGKAGGVVERKTLRCSMHDHATLLSSPRFGTNRSSTG
ncbi:hypothetical protein ACA910_016581 [Epithemia clementina (nom. ined.)]